jgi:hypothetical protein
MYLSSAVWNTKFQIKVQKRNNHYRLENTAVTGKRLSQKMNNCSVVEGHTFQIKTSKVESVGMSRNGSNFSDKKNTNPVV